MEMLEHTINNNLCIAFSGTVFTSTFFRRVFGQLPYEVETLTFTESNVKKKLIKAIVSRKSPFVAIIKDSNDQIQDIFFVPIIKEKGKYRLVA